MTDFSLLLSRIQAVYSMYEIAGILGVGTSILEHAKYDQPPRFDLGMKILALHDQVTGGKACAEAVIEAKRFTAPALLRAVPRRVKSKGAKAGQKRVNGRFA